MKQEAHKEPKGKPSKCPYCGSDYGYYRKIRYKGQANYYYKFDGTVNEDGINGEFYNFADWQEGKTKYCVQCHRKIPL
jgi:hypothetical protein